MTIPASRLRDYYFHDSRAGILIVQLDGTSYVEKDEYSVYFLIDSGLVEGRASNGICPHVRHLRMLVEPQVALQQMIAETPGSILSMASVTVVRQRDISPLLFCHRACMYLDGAA